MDQKFVTSYQTDWPLDNQSGLKNLLLAAYSETSALCDPNRNGIFSTPNQHMHTGFTRWIAVNQRLEQGCKSGLLRGIQARWRLAPNSKTCWVLELRGQFTCVTASHISDIESSPRDCAFRFDGRISNQSLMEFE